MINHTHRLILISTLWAVFLLIPEQGSAQQAPVYPCRIQAEFPHNNESSTQGLFYLNGKLYESSGGFGQSFLAISEPETGQYIHRIPIEKKHFAEGITLYDNKIFLLTWLSGTGYIHSPKTLELMTSFAYRLDSEKIEGWGILFDGNQFVLSSGTDQLRFYRTKDFARTGAMLVRDGEKPIRLLNELEYVGGMILANIWKSDRIAVIDPRSGIVMAWIDLAPLRKKISQDAGVANGIAYDNKSGRLFVTGKHWDKLFAITVDEVLWRQPVNEKFAPTVISQPASPKTN